MEDKDFINLLKRANVELKYAQKHNLVNDKIVAVKDGLEKIQGFSTNFKLTTKLDTIDRNIIETLAKKLVGNPNERLSHLTSKKNMAEVMERQHLTTKQQVLDFYDLMAKTKYDRYYSHMLDSDQVKTMYDIAKDRGMSGQEVEKIIEEELAKSAREQMIENGYVEPDDKVAMLIRERIINE